MAYAQANGVSPKPIQSPPPADANFRQLASVMGTDSFFGNLASVFAEISDCEHLHIFRVDGSRPSTTVGVSADGSRKAEQQFDAYMTAGLWDGDAEMAAANSVGCGSPWLFHTLANQMSTLALRSYFRHYQFEERLMFVSREADELVAFTVNKVGNGRTFTPEEISRLSTLSTVILPLVGRHFGLIDEHEMRMTALTSLAMIENVLMRSNSSMPPREMAVCARFIYGLSASSIALDLNIAEDTVACYRKRIYRRLTIASHHELLIWYLGIASRNSLIGLLNAGSPRIS